ncbi:hypothetical protein COO60DRAFT_772095 [Scenedesmus sp. NREL 46B-D3]|nr:hypothetical protein COO60DRAFT_772095 [Scenedesmus sp. NREL 46B-D3]
MTCRPLLLLMVAAVCCWVFPAVEAQQCTGYLPGNCRVEQGLGFMHCNAGSFCQAFGFPAQHNACESAATCDAMCAAASRWGGYCVQAFRIPWELHCGGRRMSVKVLQAQIHIPGHGTVNCDDRFQVAGEPATRSVANKGGGWGRRRLL